MSRTHEQVMVVTGASSGIGEAVAHLAARRAHHVVLVARHEEQLADVAAECRRLGAASTLTVVADVGDDATVAAMVKATLAEHGRIDAVLNCAGVVSYGRTETTDPDDFEKVVRTNLLGSASVARHTIPVLREQGAGDLVLVGSLLGHIAVPDMTPYVVSKWGVRGLARQLHIENLDRPHVRITHVSPGSVRTPIYDNALDDGDGNDDGHRPPPPSISPERAARSILGAVGSRRLVVHPAAANYGMIAAFTLVPRVYDRLIGPAFRLLSAR